MGDKRQDFLFKMYDQMFNDIDRHHKIVWQVVGVLAGSFALLALSEKGIIPIDVTISIVMVLGLWVIAHVYDSNYWYNRNLVIISNIERQFLKKEDLRDIHYYFGKHRNENAIQTSLKIQMFLAWFIITLFLIYHFIVRIVPGFNLKWKDSVIDWLRLLPYFILILIYFTLVRWLRRKRINDYLEFLKQSPGIEVDTSEIVYGAGHPTQGNE